MPTISEVLRDTSSKLKKAKIETARLDSLLIIEWVTKKDRAWLLANQESEISPKEARELNKLLIKRLTHLPIAYIFEQTEFYGREFIVSNDVLVPRPETEVMIKALNYLLLSKDFESRKIHKPFIADVGTGSGAIGITAKLEHPEVVVDLIDIDLKALKIAKFNVDKYTLTLHVICSDLLDNTGNVYDILLCNLPYVPDGHSINKAASHEPKLAIFGGKDGLKAYRKLFKQLRSKQSKPLYLLIESLPSQHSALTDMATPLGYSKTIIDDFIILFTLV
jgi:release factor glutamine methyltransferase